MGRRHDLPAPPPLVKDAEVEYDTGIPSHGSTSPKARRKIKIRSFKKQPVKTKPKQSGNFLFMNRPFYSTEFADNAERKNYQKHLNAAVRSWLFGKALFVLTEDKIEQIVGISREEFRKHLNREDMKYYHEGATIDHIIPQCLARTPNESFALSHYSNLQLLSEADNKHKSDRIPEDGELHPDSTEDMIWILHREKEQ